MFARTHGKIEYSYINMYTLSASKDYNFYILIVSVTIAVFIMIFSLFYSKKVFKTKTLKKIIFTNFF